MRFDVVAAACPTCGSTKKKFIWFHEKDNHFKSKGFAYSPFLEGSKPCEGDKDHMHYTCRRCSCSWGEYDGV